MPSDKVKLPTSEEILKTTQEDKILTEEEFRELYNNKHKDEFFEGTEEDDIEEVHFD